MFHGSFHGSGDFGDSGDYGNRMNFHPLYLSTNTWMLIVGVYIAIASVAPVWILLQPRDYLSSFLLYAMLAVAFIGVVGAHPNIDAELFPALQDCGG